MNNANSNAKFGMSLTKKLLVALCALAAVVTIVVTSVLATVAYLTSSAAVSNVFTVGNVTMKMTETKVNPDGTPVDPAERVDTNTYHLVPGKTYLKDPVITIEPGSENSYLFVLVRNDLETIAANTAAAPSIARQLNENGWAKYTKAATGWVYVYVGFDDFGDTNAPETDLTTNAASSNLAAKEAVVGQYKLFEEFTIASTVTDKELQIYNGAKITLTAAAIQADGEENFTLDAAWAAIVATYPYIHTGTN